MENKIVIPCEFGDIVIEKCKDSDYKEAFIGIVKNGVWMQDIAVVRNAYHYDDNNNVVLDDHVEVLVYADKDNEDYTNKFEIGIYNEDD